MGLVSSTKVLKMGISRDAVQEIINSDKVVIFSKTTCPYCKMAKEVNIEKIDFLK